MIDVYLDDKPHTSCKDGHILYPPGRWPTKNPWKGCPPTACQFCNSVHLDFQHYGDNAAWCADCHRKSLPVSATVCWEAMRFIRSMGGNVQTWDLLADTLERIISAKLAGQPSELPQSSHAECIASRALHRSAHNGVRAIKTLQEWAAEACEC